jgi:hypothetical protein
MKARIAELIAALRRAEVRVSVAEAMDAARAAATVGVARPVLRDALAAALVKDERDRSIFLAAFDVAFPARSRDAATAPRKRRAPSAGGEGGSGGSTRAAGEPSAGTSATPSRPTASASAIAAERRGSSGGDDGEHAEQAPGAEKANAPNADDESRDGRDADGASDVDGMSDARLRQERERRLCAQPFRAMSPMDVEHCTDLARAIAARITARVRRRRKPRTTGRLDFRRTIRAAVPRGGVPFERRYRGRRPGAPDLVALCDLSVSAATATGFFLSLLAPATAYFRRVRLFGYVDRLVEIEFAAGQVRPAAPVDLMARSDFGRVLRDLVEAESAALTADTVLLVLGDARNNRRPPRPDLLATARARVRRALWLNPDPHERWNTGDSVIAAYAKHMDAVVACGTLAELERALAAVARAGGRGR